MVTILIIIAVLSVGVGLWLINKKQNDELKEINKEDHLFADDLAPEVTPAAIAETIAKKNNAPKKKVADKKPVAKKSVSKKSK